MKVQNAPSTDLAGEDVEAETGEGAVDGRHGDVGEGAARPHEVPRPLAVLTAGHQTAHAAAQPVHALQPTTRLRHCPERSFLLFARLCLPSLHSIERIFHCTIAIYSHVCISPSLD